MALSALDAAAVTKAAQSGFPNDPTKAAAAASSAIQAAGGVQQTTTQVRNAATSNTTKLNNTLTSLGGTSVGGTAGAPTGGMMGAGAGAPAGGTNTVTVTRDQDNGDGTRTVTYSDGSSAKVTATKNPDGTLSYKELEPGAPTSYEEKQIQAVSEVAKQQITNANATLDRIKSTSDVATNALIESIKQIYGARISQMIDTNSRILAGKTTAGIREGRARYMTEIQNGVLTDEEQAGIMRVSQLEGEMLQEIAKAQQAQNEEDLTIFNDRMDKVTAIQKDLADQVAKIHQAALDAQKAQLDAQKTALDMQKTQQDIFDAKIKAAAPAIMEALSGLASPADKSDFLKAYAEQSGIPIDQLMSGVSAAATDKEKADLQLEQTRASIESSHASAANSYSLIASRNKQTALDSGDTEVTNIVNGVSTIDDVDKAKVEQIKTRLQELGFYDETPPDWYVRGKNAMAGASISPEAIKSDWDTYRKNATGAS